MKLCVGVVGKSDGWHLLLQQEGIAHSQVTDSLLPDDFSVVVAGDSTDDRESEMLRQYLNLGGAVLCSVKVYARLRQTTCQTSYIKYILTNHNTIFDNVGLVDVYDKCYLAWNANDLLNNRNTLSAHFGTYGDGFIIALPFDPSLISLDRRSQLKTFYSPEKRLPFESVSLVSKGTVRLLVSNALEWLHHKRGFPYVHLWYFPFGARSIFCFRIDTDDSEQEKIKNLYLLSHRNNVPMSWFVDVKSQQSFLRLYAEMENQEIGVHCYDHVVYRDLKSNVRNIQKATSLLHKIGITPKGFASPYGQWNENLAQAILDAGFEYSSEFGYDYDNVPSRAGNGILQVPVHPICIGSLKRHSYTATKMIRYFDFNIRRKLAAREPIAFYHHPNDGNQAVLEWLFDVMRRERIPVKTMSEFAQWWHRREAFLSVGTYSTNSIQFPSADFNRDVQIRITRPDGTEAIIPIAKQIFIDTIRWESKPPVFQFPDDFLRQRRFNYRIPLTHAADLISTSLRGIKK